MFHTHPLLPHIGLKDFRRHTFICNYTPPKTKMSDSSWWSCWCTHNVRCVVCFVFVLFAFIFDVIGFAVPHWFYVSIGGVTTYGGLWKLCVDAGTLSCKNYVDIDAEGNYCLAYGILHFGVLNSFTE